MHRQEKKSTRRLAIVLLSLILLVGLFLRIWGLDFGLPYLYHPDEPNKITMAQAMFKTGDLNPHYFKKPTLLIYLNAAAYVPYYLLGKFSGVFQARQEITPPIMLTMGVGKMELPSAVVMGRMLTTLAAVLSLILVFLVARQSYKEYAAGILAAVMMAISPTNVANSRYITVNAYLALAILAVVLFSLRLYAQGRVRDYIFAGLFAGVVISFKYPGVIAIVPVLAAHFMRTGRAGFRDRNLYFALALVPIAFLIGTPFALLDYRKFLEDTLYELVHYRTGHAGMEGNSLAWYLSYAWQTEGLVTILAVLETARAWYRRDKPAIILSTFPLTYFVFISLFTVRNDRTFLPLTPFLFVLGSALLVRCYHRAAGLGSRWSRAAASVLLAIILIAALGMPALLTIRSGQELNIVDGRETARIWIEDNLSPGARVALESYTPFVEPNRFSVQGMGQMIDHEPDWYVAQGFEYLVFGQSMFGRYFSEPDKYALEVAAYERFFETFELVRKFTDGGYEVRIYRVPQQ